MSEGRPHSHSLPNDFEQIPIVWRYELLRYLRSWRLIASIAIAVAMMALLYLLPPLLGASYSGTDSNRLVYMAPPDLLEQLSGIPGAPYSVGFLNRTSIDMDSLRLYIDGANYASGSGATWMVVRTTHEGSSIYLILFMQDVSGHVITASYDWHTAPDSFAGSFLAFVSFLIIIAATLFGADSLAGEFQNRTGYLMFPTPLKRWVMFFGKFAASLTATLMVIVLYYGGVAGMSAISADGIDDDYALSFAYSVEYAVAVLAIAYLISSLMKGTTGATVLTFLLFIIILPIFDSIGNFTGVKMEASLGLASSIITSILTDPYPTDWTMDAGMGASLSVFYPTPWIAAVVMFGYFAVSTSLSLVLFKRKQLAG